MTTRGHYWIGLRDRQAGSPSPSGRTSYRPCLRKDFWRSAGSGRPFDPTRLAAISVILGLSTKR